MTSYLETGMSKSIKGTKSLSMVFIAELHLGYMYLGINPSLIWCEIIKISLNKERTTGNSGFQCKRIIYALSWVKKLQQEPPHGILSLNYWSENQLTVEIEDKEASIWKVAVELEQDLVGGTICRFEGCVATENSQLGWVLIGTIPRKTERGGRLSIFTSEWD